MDDVTRLIAAFGSRGKHDHVAWKLDILMDLGRIAEPRVVPFLAAVVLDDEEPVDVRLDALGRLREAAVSTDTAMSTGAPDAQGVAADASLAVLMPPVDLRMRLHAALVLGAFVERPGVVGALGAVACNPEEPIELRYNAFTSLQRAGATSACVALLRVLASDDMLGQSASALLASWGTR